MRAKLKELEETYHADHLPSGASELVNSIQDRLATDMERIKIGAQKAYESVSNSYLKKARTEFAEAAGIFKYIYYCHICIYGSNILKFYCVKFKHRGSWIALRFCK